MQPVGPETPSDSTVAVPRTIVSPAKARPERKHLGADAYAEFGASAHATLSKVVREKAANLVPRSLIVNVRGTAAVVILEFH